MYKVFIERRAEHDLGKLEPAMLNRVIEHLLDLRTNPRMNAKKLAGSKNIWRVRIGDWRAIYEIDDKRKEARIYRIKHRAKAY